MLFRKIRHFAHLAIGRGARVMRIDLHTFLKGWSWLFSSQMIGAVMSLMLAYGYANFLTQETYGTYKYVLSILGLLSILSLQGMEDASQRSIARGKDAAFWSTFKIRIAWSAVGALFAAAIGFYYFIQGNTLLATAFLAASPFLIGLESLTHFRTIFLGRQQFRTLSYYTIFTQVLASLAIVSAVLFSDNLTVLIVTYTGSFVLLRGLAFIHATRTQILNTKPDDDSTRYGSHMSVIGVLGSISGYIDSILVWHFLGPAPLAIYSFAIAVVAPIRRVLKLATSSMAFPKFSSQDTETIKKTLPRKVWLAHGITIPGAALCALLVPYLYHGLFPTYTSSIPFAQAFILLLGFAPMRFFATAVIAKASTRIIYIHSIAIAGSQAILLVTLIPLFGIWGIVLTTAFQQVFGNFLGFYLFKKM